MGQDIFLGGQLRIGLLESVKMVVQILVIIIGDVNIQGMGITIVCLLEIVWGAVYKMLNFQGFKKDSFQMVLMYSVEEVHQINNNSIYHRPYEMSQKIQTHNYNN